MFSTKFTIALLTALAVSVSAAPVPGSAYSGLGGSANGGSVTDIQKGLVNVDALNLFSGNGGRGGKASSGNAIASRDSYTGSGGSAQGGSVDKIEKGLVNVDALNFFSGNGGRGGKASSGNAFSSRSSYSGVGGSANGGSVTHVSGHGVEASALNAFSGNAGKGGNASSGSSVSSHGDAYSGAGGQANGGSVYEYDGRSLHGDVIEVGGTHFVHHARSLHRGSLDVEVGAEAKIVDSHHNHKRGDEKVSAFSDVSAVSNKHAASVQASGQVDVSKVHRRSLLGLENVVAGSGAYRNTVVGDGLLDGKVLGVGSDNAGNGGIASSGNAISN